MQSFAEISKDRMEITLKTHVFVYDHVVDVAKMGDYRNYTKKQFIGNRHNNQTMILSNVHNL